MTTSAQLIWDFRGPNALHTAKHHKMHLEEFIAIEDIDITDLKVTKISEVHVCVSMLSTMKHVPFLRERLKPHRGKKVTI